MRVLHTSIVSVATAVLVACNGRSSAPIDQFGCPIDSVLEQLIYPAPGSTGIPDAVSPIVLGSPIATVTLQPPRGSPIVATAVPNPIPSPNAAPRTSPISAYVVPTLAAATTYTVIAQAPPPGPIGGCPAQPAQTLGSFTTQ
jgi:hypothetical protein